MVNGGLMASTASGSLIWLLIGSPFDPLVDRVATDLRAGGCACVVVQNPLTAPSRLSWHLDSASSRWSMATPEGIEMTPDNLGGVFVRHHPWVDRVGWDARDAEYVQSETSAAMLAWLWALDRTVVGRMPADLWYRPGPGSPGGCRGSNGPVCAAARLSSRTRTESGRPSGPGSRAR